MNAYKHHQTQKVNSADVWIVHGYIYIVKASASRRDVKMLIKPMVMWRVWPHHNMVYLSMCISKNRRHSSRFGELKFSSIDKKSLYFTSRVDSLSLTRSLSCSKQTPTIIFLLHHCRYHYHRNAASTFISQAAQLLPLLIFFFLSQVHVQKQLLFPYINFTCAGGLSLTLHNQHHSFPVLGMSQLESILLRTPWGEKKNKTKGGYTTAATVTQ